MASSRSRSPSEIDDEYNLDAILNSSEPTIELNLPAYETSAANFSRAIANFTARSIAEITQRREAHDKELKRLADRAQDVERETEQCKLKEIELIALLKCEREETEEAESAVASLRRRVEAEREVLASIDANIQTLRARVANLRKERELERDTLAMHAGPMSAEVRACERATGLVIEGVGPDQLLFRYTIKVVDDDSRSTHEVSFVIDLSSQFKVLTSTPQLPIMPLLLDQLNESGDVYTFIKRVRQAYVKLLS
ncbi:hypothetical protein H4582DRAFT_1986495 [Lactarius indigo]|nr:hypothetical protein H4582DRAFT_1986495 [Lactarius indigo]